jgi:hypothetical protein
LNFLFSSSPAAFLRLTDQSCQPRQLQAGWRSNADEGIEVFLLPQAVGAVAAETRTKGMAENLSIVSWISRIF